MLRIQPVGISDRFVEGNRQVERTIPHYDLDMIISVGYRVNSKRATQFRQWATKRLNEYIRKGFALYDERLKNGGGRYFRELLQRVRDIRSSERNLYQQVTDIYATAIDYDPKADMRESFSPQCRIKCTMPRTNIPPLKLFMNE